MTLFVDPTRHPGTQHYVLNFAYEHLSEGRMRDTSHSCCDLAQQMIDTLPDGIELTVGLRKLSEAKDAFVRQAIRLEQHLATKQIPEPTYSVAEVVTEFRP